MPIIVQKFGGTSVADVNKIKNVAQVVINEKSKGNSVVVVVSAMGHTTDRLIDIANEITANPSKREMDMLMSTGEQVSASLLAMQLVALGHKAVSLNAFQAEIMTEDNHMQARIVNIRTKRMEKYINEGNAVIVTGFQGITDENEVMTLGRGGSDTSAVAIAVALNAQRCDIYTDVEGVYTTDPRIVPCATRLSEVSYDEMLELARVGANVLHPRAVETAKQYSMPLRVRSTFKKDNSGTLIIGADKMEMTKTVTGVACDLSQIRIVVCDVPDRPGNAAKLFSMMAENNLSVDMIIQSYARSSNNTNDIAFTISEADFDKFEMIAPKIKRELNANNIYIDHDIAKVTIVGAGMIDKPGIAADMFTTIANQGVNIKMISTSEIKISCLVKKSEAKEVLKVLHTAFKLDSSEVAVVKGDLPY